MDGGASVLLPAYDRSTGFPTSCPGGGGYKVRLTPFLGRRMNRIGCLECTVLLELLDTANLSKVKKDNEAHSGKAKSARSR